MSGRKRKKPGSVFDSIRKPTAPPSQSHDADRRDERSDPVGRKAKHKKKLSDDKAEFDV